MAVLQLEDVELYYEMTGEGEPLLLIHGLGSSVRDWQEQVPFFAEQFQVITVDVRGHGRSTKPPGPYSVPKFTEDIVKLLQSLHVGPVHVIGLSMGGMIAFQMGVSWPQMVRSLVIVNSGPELVVRSIADQFMVWQRQLIVRLLGMRKMGEVLSTRLFPKPEQEVLRQLLIERWAENDGRAYRDTMKALVGWSVADQIGDIQCPMLVVASDQDYTPVAEKEAYVQRIPNAELLVIEDARHALPMEKPGVFNTAVSAFIASVVPE